MKEKILSTRPGTVTVYYDTRDYEGQQLTSTCLNVRHPMNAIRDELMVMQEAGQINLLQRRVDRVHFQYLAVRTGR